MFSFAFCLFIEERKKNIKKTQEIKHTEELYPPGIEPGTPRSPVLHFTTALMHKVKNYYRKSLLNNGDYLNYNLY